MVTDKILTKFGFAKDEGNLQLKSVLKDNVRLKEIHIDAYPENPLIPSNEFSLLLRTTEKNVDVSIDNDRIVLKKNDVCKTHFVNVLMSKITECFSKISENYSEFILNIHNIYYRITITN